MKARFATVLLASVLMGCSALGLSSDLDRAPCMACAELDAIEPPPPCMSWQCTTPDDPMNGVCELDLIDADQDDAPVAECATDERPADCDDQDGNNAPMREESCDLVDNDCDGSIDEDALAVGRVALIPADSGGELSAFSFASDGLERATAYRGDGALLAARLPFDGTAVAAPVVLGGAAQTANARETAIARAGTEWAVAYSEGSGCSRVVLGLWNESGSALIAAAGHASVGLPKVEGDCAGADASEAGSPSLAASSGRQALVAYLAQRDARECGDGPAAVALVVAQRNEASGPFTEFSASATEVGASTDATPPSLLAAPGFGYLLAFADADGIGVHRVQVDGIDRTVSVSELYREPCDGDCGDAHLARSGDEVGLAFRQGACGEEATAALRVLTIDEAAATLTSSGALRVGEAAAGLRRPTAARRTGPDEWVLSWAVTVGTTRRVMALRFDVEGLPVGPPFALLETEGAFPGALALTAGVGAEGLAAFTLDSGADALVRGSAICALEQ